MLDKQRFHFCSLVTIRRVFPFDVQSRIVKIVEIFGIIYLTLSVLALYVHTYYSIQNENKFVFEFLV